MLRQLAKNTFPLIFLSILISSTLIGCEKTQKPSQPKTHIIEARIQESNTQLYYSGIVQPLRIVNLTSPIDGTVKAVHFHYGAMVKNGQLLVELSSVKSKEDYVNALTTYLKEKDQFLRSKNSFEATTALFKAGIIDKESYLNEKSQLNTNQIAYISALEALKQITPRIAGAHQNIQSLTLENVGALENILKKQLEKIKIYSPISGVALAPQKSAEQNLNSEKILTEHSEVKQNQTIMDIGDMSGISTVITITEADINYIKPNQSALISVPAVPGLLLQGKISTIPRQAKNSDAGGGALANFNVQIKVPTISDVQRSLLRIGMTAKINITIHNPPQIKIPITAVFKKNDVNLITIINPKTGKSEDIRVETGETDLTQVVISKGLKAGDKVLVHD